MRYRNFSDSGSSAQQWSFVLVCIYLLAVLEIVNRGGQEEFFTPEKVAYMAIFMLTIFCWVMKRLAQGDLGYLLFYEPVFRLVLLLILYYLLINPLWSILNDIPIKGAFREQLRLANLLLIPVIYSEITTEKRLWNLYILILTVVGIACLLDIWYIMHNVQSILNRELGNDLALSSYYIIGPGLILPLFYYYRKNFAKLLMLFPLLGIFIFRIILSYERFHIVGAFLLISLIIIINYISRNGSRSFATKCLLGLMVFASCMAYLSIKTDILHIYSQRLQVLDYGLSNRAAEYTQALKGFWESPLLGQGNGAEISYVRHRSYAGGHVVEYAHIHNIVLYHLFHGGLIGAFLYLSIWWFFFKNGWNLLYRVHLGSREFVVLSSFMLSGTYLFANSLLQTFFARQEMNYLLAVMVASIMALRKKYAARLAARRLVPAPPGRYRRAPAALNLE